GDPQSIRIHRTSRHDSVLLKAGAPEVLHGRLQATLTYREHSLPPPMRCTLLLLFAGKRFCLPPTGDSEFLLQEERGGAVSGRSAASRQALKSDKCRSDFRRCRRCVLESMHAVIPCVAPQFSQTGRQDTGTPAQSRSCAPYNFLLY